MSLGASNLSSSSVAATTGLRAGPIAFWLVLSLHGLAVLLMAATEASLLGMLVFLLVWIMLNCLWLAVLRRPSVAALLSLEFLAVLALLSRFKYDKLWMTIDFVDVLIVDQDTSAFLLATFPALRWWVLLSAAATVAAVIFAWRLDQYRVSRIAGVIGLSMSALALIGTALSCPTDLHEDFVGRSYVSKFARTGVEAIHELSLRGYLEAADDAGERLVGAADFVCHPPQKLPHIILLHDESSFDITAAP